MPSISGHPQSYLIMKDFFKYGKHWILVQKSQEKEMEDLVEELVPHQDFKTRKQIRYEKYGIDEDEDAILNQKIHMPRQGSAN